MRKLLFLSSLALTLCSTGVIAQTAKKGAIYGKAFTSTQVLSTTRAAGVTSEKDVVENVQFEGKVTEVCQKEGCWLVLSTDNGADPLMVRMKDHSFKVPKDLNGKHVVVNGNLKKTTQSVEEQKHLLEDKGASQGEIARITAPKNVFELIATGVVVTE
ncbi:DUF4920 domain-containing protein [Taibaiella lutea]|uniref:DUF4920 domain-containing protein n=1 Tax=Taibaiella lutea TaxID=2608001 RepID=A0A5M6CJ65_9BACT|nr:DUF4920 domain-containing protein [Taibaiella lutea]KAA5535063.1 DUF4920 domain-containing protein [Taibaiella lutea]